MPAAGRPVVVSRTWQVMGSLEAIFGRWEVRACNRSMEVGLRGMKLLLVRDRGSGRASAIYQLGVGGS